MYHHVHYTWHHIHTLWQQPLVFMTSHALYSWHHMHYISHVIYCMISHSLYVWHHTMPVSLTPHSLCLWYIHYRASHSVMTTQTLCNFTATMSDITPTVSLSSHPLYWGYHTSSILEISSAIYDDIISSLYDITGTECVSSQKLFQRYNTLCMWDIKPTICKISYTV